VGSSYFLSCVAVAGLCVGSSLGLFITRWTDAGKRVRGRNEGMEAESEIDCSLTTGIGCLRRALLQRFKYVGSF